MKHSRLSRVAWGLLAAALLYGVAVTFIAERTVPTLLLTYFVLPQMLSIPALLILGLGLWRRQAVTVAASALAVTASLALMGWHGPGFARTAVAAPAQPALRLMTYNVARGAGGVAALAQTTAGHQPDVVCLQEINGLDDTFFDRLLQRLPGYTVVRAREVALLSRTPWHDRRETPLPGTTRSLLSAVVLVGDQPVRVLNAHFTTVPLRGGWVQARQARERQLQAVLEQVRGSTGPLVVCGDFNTPAHGLVYARLKQSLGNAFENAGQGAGYTFPSGVPLVRIDHVWLREIRAVRAEVVGSRASDHRPLLVGLALP